MKIDELSSPEQIARAIKDYAKKEDNQQYINIVEKHIGDEVLLGLNKRPMSKQENYAKAIKNLYDECVSTENKITLSSINFTKASVNFLESKAEIKKIIEENEQIKKNIEKPLKPLKKSSFNFFKSQEKIYEIEKESNKIKRENQQINIQNEQINNNNNNKGNISGLKTIEKPLEQFMVSLKEINKLELEQKITLSIKKISVYLKGTREIENLITNHLSTISQEGFQLFTNEAINLKTLSKEDKKFIKETYDSLGIEGNTKGIKANIKMLAIKTRIKLDKRLAKYDKEKDLVKGKGVVSKLRAKIKPIQIG